MNRLLIRIRHFFTDIGVFGILLISLGSLVWSLTMVKSGIVYDYGMGFWGPNGHDGVWHISLAQGLANGSWDIPVFAGEAIKNYHIGFDLLLAVIHKLTLIPIHTLYFQVIPPLLAFGIGISAYKFVFSWTKSKAASLWSVFFIYFGGNFGWIVTFIRDGKIGGESMFWSQQSVSTLINPPFALSVLIIFVGLNYLIKGLRSKVKGRRKFFLTIATLLFGILIQIKVYAGLLVVTGLFSAGAWWMIKRKGFQLIKVASGVLLLSLLLFLPMNNGSVNSIVFKPFWFLETMMSFPDRVGWQKFGEAMVNYRLGKVWFKGVLAYIVAFIIFWYGNLGSRILMELMGLKWSKKLRHMQWVEIFLLTIILVGVIISMFFVQRGTPWNTIQFTYYSLMFSGIFAGIVVADILKKLKSNTLLTHVIGAGVIILTIPTTLGTLQHYLPSRPPAKISNEELEALQFLKEQPNGVVLTLPFDRDKANAAVDNPPRPLYLYESTAYVSAFTGKPVYLEDEVNLEITGYEWRERREEVEEILRYEDVEILRDYANSNDISYLYLQKPLLNQSVNHLLPSEAVFKNSEIEIYYIN